MADPVSPTPTASKLDDVTYGDGAVWVLNGLQRTLTRVDPTTGTTSHLIRESGFFSVTAGRGSLWVLAHDGTLARLRPDGSQLWRRTIPTNHDLQGVMLQHGRLIVSYGTG